MANISESQLYIIVNHQQRLKIILSQFYQLVTPPLHKMHGGALWYPFKKRTKPEYRFSNEEEENTHPFWYTKLFTTEAATQKPITRSTTEPHRQESITGRPSTNEAGRPQIQTEDEGYLTASDGEDDDPNLDLLQGDDSDLQFHDPEDPDEANEGPSEAPRQPKDYKNACVLMITFPKQGFVKVQLIHEGEVVEQKKNKVYFDSDHDIAKQGIMFNIRDDIPDNPLNDLQRRNIQICLLRHGSALHNEMPKKWLKLNWRFKGTDWGKKDTSLTSTGIGQVQKAAEKLHDTIQGFKGKITLFCSDLRRTMQTASIVKITLKDFTFARPEIIVFPCVHELASNTSDRNLLSSRMFNEFQRENVSIWKQTREEHEKQTLSEEVKEIFKPPFPAYDFISKIQFNDEFYRRIFQCSPYKCSNSTFFELLVDFSEDEVIGPAISELQPNLLQDCNPNYEEVLTMLDNDTESSVIKTLQTRMARRSRRQRSRFAFPRSMPRPRLPRLTFSLPRFEKPSWMTRRGGTRRVRQIKRTRRKFK